MRLDAITPGDLAREIHGAEWCMLSPKSQLAELTVAETYLEAVRRIVNPNAHGAPEKPDRGR